MWVALAHAEVPTCEECQRFLHDKDWRPVKRLGQKVARPPGAQPPCWKCPKSGPTNGHPVPEADMIGRNARAWELYLTIQAGASMPDDEIVRQNCALIQLVVEQERATRQGGEPIALALLASLSAKRK